MSRERERDRTKRKKKERAGEEREIDQREETK